MARIEHFAVFAADLERTQAFYVEALGLRVVVDNSQAPIAGYFLGDDRGVALEVIRRPPGVAAVETRYACHSAFLVDDYPAAKRRLEALGVGFEADTEVVTPEFQTGFFRDPDGNRCQIVWRARTLGS